MLGSVPDNNDVRKLVLQPATRIPLQPSHTETPTNIEPKKYDQCGNSTE